MTVGEVVFWVFCTISILITARVSIRNEIQRRRNKAFRQEWANRQVEDET